MKPYCMPYRRRNDVSGTSAQKILSSNNGWPYSKASYGCTSKKTHRYSWQTNLPEPPMCLFLVFDHIFSFRLKRLPAYYFPSIKPFIDFTSLIKLITSKPTHTPKIPIVIITNTTPGKLLYHPKSKPLINTSIII